MFLTRSIAFTLLLAVVGGCTSTSGPGACTVPEDEEALIEEVVTLVNRARAAEGVEPLVFNVVLGAVAQDHACEMVEDDFFAHENPRTNVSPGERLTAAGYIYYAMGENLAVGQDSAAEVVSDWLDSPRHRANILSPDWREIGVAVRTGGVYDWYWVQEFADPVDFGQE